MKKRESLSWLTARPIAHRGLHGLGPGVVENSLCAARAALAKGYGIECDVRLSRDGKVFVFHDDRLERLTAEEGAFVNRNAADLEGVGLRDSDEKIPSLEQFLALARGAGPLILELKSDFSGNPALAAAVAASLSDYAGPVAVKSFDPAQIAFLRATGSRWPLGIVAQEHYDEEEFAELTLDQCHSMRRFTHAAETQPDFLSWRAADLPHPLCEFARACAGMPVMAWTIRTPTQAAAARQHADQIVFEGFAA